MERIWLAYILKKMIREPGDWGIKVGTEGRLRKREWLASKVPRLVHETKKNVGLVMDSQIELCSWSGLS